MSYSYTNCSGKYKVPASVRREARLGLKLKAAGFDGGTATGWRRARQLINCDTVSGNTVKTMKAWFARHGPRAKNGGTSKPGYDKWVRHGKPTKPTKETKRKYRGAVAWLIWGGDPALKWVDGILL
ncbi:MAG: hypothetical protein R3213_09895 [Flavobacteriaceae bacterium]|nr:hypothetical protein [Flavobacteriaceae bacterium]